MSMASSSHATSSTRSRAPTTVRRCSGLTGIRPLRRIPISLSILWRRSLAASGLSGSTIRTPCMQPRPRLPWCESRPDRRWASARVFVSLLVILGAACTGAVLLLAGELSPYTVEDRRSGYTYLSEENQRLQDDDFANPGLLCVELGRDLWQQTDGAACTSCGRCHGDAAVSMRGVRPRYPRFEAQRGKLINLEQQINHCRAERMHAPSYPYEDEALLALTTFVAFQSR